MKRKLMFSGLLLLFYFSSCSQKSAPENVQQTISALETGFKMKSIQHVTPVLSKSFSFNDFSPLLSKQVLAGIVNGFPLKEIKGIEVIENQNDTLQVTCKLVIDKFMGLLSQSIDLTLVNQNGQLVIQKLIIPDAEMEVNMEDDDRPDAKQQNIQLDDYHHLGYNEVPTFYEEGLEKIAAEVNEKQVAGIEIAEQIMGEELIFKLGLLLTKDSLKNAKIDQPVLPVTLNLPDYEADEKTGFFLNWAYFHELVELQLSLGKGIMDQNTRWFRDGMAEYVAHRVAYELNPLADSLMMKRRMNSYEEIDRKANLLEWIGTGNTDEKMEGIVGGPGQYTGALLFFIDLTEQYGEAIIPALLAKLTEQKDIDNEIIIKELSSLTGSDVTEKIEKY